MKKQLFNKIYKKLSKDTENLWYLNQDSSLSPPFQLTEAETPLQTATVNIGFSLLPAPS